MPNNLTIDYSGAISKFGKILKEFQIKKIIYKTVFRSRGLEFESYSDYTPDADASWIDWKASMKSNKLLIKKYKEERNLNFYFLVDASTSMLFGSRNKLKAEYAGEVVSALSYLILNSNDLVGLILFSDHEAKVLQPTNNKNQFNLIVRNLGDSSLYGSEFNLASAIDYLLSTVRQDSVIVIVSDFIKLNQRVNRQLKLLASKYETIGLMIRDPLDIRIPKINYPLLLQDSKSGRQILVDPSIVSERYKEISEMEINEVRDLFKSSSVDLLELETDKEFALPIASFLKKRASAGRFR
jgi:uncharacterized protein (DUF58 family)